MKIGVFGGTFDPPHLGHLELARSAVRHLELDEVLFVPASRNPEKRPTTTPARDRLEMVKIAIEGDPTFAVSDLEIRRGGESYAVETLEQLTFARPAEYWFLIGSDSLKELHRWKQPERLTRLCRLGATIRDFDDIDHVLASLPEYARSRVDFFTMPRQAISSSELRKRLATNGPTLPWLPDAVKQYIVSHDLYRSEFDDSGKA